MGESKREREREREREPERWHIRLISTEMGDLPETSQHK